jgi:hypothetical protein
MEENLINASDYIYNVLNVIDTFEDFKQYKPELIKAILDIKNNLSKFFEKKFYYNNNNNINEEVKNNNNEHNIYNNQKKTLSSSLGLRYNYDQYLDISDKDIQPEKLKLINNTIDINTDNNLNNKNNLLNPQKINENKNYNINEINNNLLIANKSNSHNNLISVPQVFQQSNNNNNKINNNQNIIANIPYAQSDFNNKKNYVNLNNNYEPKLNKQIEIPSNDDKKNLLTHVADVVMKINNDKELFDILSELFGTNVVEELLNQNVKPEFLQNVEKSIEEIERLRSIDEQKNNIHIINNPQKFNNNNINNNVNNNFNNNNINSEPLFYETGEEKKRQNSQIKKPSYSDLLLKKHNLEIKNENNFFNNQNKKNIKEKTEPYKEFNFESSLRFNMKRPQSCRRSNNNSNLTTNSNVTNKPLKRFVNYTSNYGHYFDESLQKGGVSKLPAFKVKSSLNKRINSPLREYLKSYQIV